MTNPNPKTPPVVRIWKSWRLMILCMIVCMPLLAATSLRDNLYRAANRIIPSWQQQANEELLVAIDKNDLRRVKLLASRGADVNFQKSPGETPLFHALSLRKFGWPQFGVATYLVEHGADPNTITVRDKTIFFDFAENYLQNERDPQFKSSVALLRVMLNAGIKPYAERKEVDILYQAVQLQSVRHVRELLQNGVDPNAPLRTTGPGTTTPLLAAVHALNPELVEILLKHRADPNLIGGIYSTDFTDSPLVQVFSYRDFPKPLSPSEFKIASLLLRAGANVNARATSDMSKNMTPVYNGWPPLHYAVFANDMQTAKLLLRHGASPKLRDDEGKTALDYARSEKKLDVVRALDAAMEKPN